MVLEMHILAEAVVHVLAEAAVVHVLAEAMVLEMHVLAEAVVQLILADVDLQHHAESWHMAQ